MLISNKKIRTSICLKCNDEKVDAKYVTSCGKYFHEQCLKEWYEVHTSILSHKINLEFEYTRVKVLNGLDVSALKWNLSRLNMLLQEAILGRFDETYLGRIYDLTIDGNRNTYQVPKFVENEQFHLNLIKVLSDFIKDPSLLRNALGKGSHYGQLDVVKYVIEVAKLEDGYSMPLSNVCSSEHLDIIKYLFEKKIDIYETYLDIKSIPLIGVNVLTFLHEQNEELFVNNEIELLSLIKSICEFGRLDIFKFLVEKYPDIDFMKILKSVPLCDAVCNLDLVKFMIDQGVDINSATEFKETALYVACYEGHLDVAKHIYEIKQTMLEPSVTELEKLPCLLNSACSSGHLDILKFFIDKVTKSEENLLASELLHTSSTNGHEKIVEFLLDRGIDVNIKDPTGATPLLHATKKNRISIMEMLLENGADPNIKNTLGEPLIHTIYTDQLKFDMFLKYKADTRAKDNKGMTVMHLACQKYSYKAVEAMISHGAFHYEVTNDQGKLPIDLLPNVVIGMGVKEDIKKLLK